MIKFPDRIPAALIGTAIVWVQPQFAVALTNLVVAQQPTVQNLINSARIKVEKGDYQGAIADLTQALQLNPNNLEAYYLRANAYYHLENYQGAIADFTQAITLNPDYVGAYTGRGIAYLNLGDKPKALEDFRQAATLFQQQGDTEKYQYTQQIIRRLEQ